MSNFWIQICFLKFLLRYFYILVVLGLHCCADFSLAAVSRGYSLLVVRRLLTAVPSLVVEHGLYGALASVGVIAGLSSTGSVVGGHGLSCSTACGIFLGQGLKLCLLHLQAGSFITEPPGKPQACFLSKYS